MMHGYFGFPGQVSYQSQVRVRAPYRGCPDIANVQLELGSAQPLASGTYRGAPGHRVRPAMRQRDQDIRLFAGLGIPLTGPLGLTASGLGVTDRESCQALATTGAGIYQAVSGAVAASQPNATEAQRQAAARLAAQLAAGGSGVNALSNLCNLIDSTNPTPNSVDPRALIAEELARIQAAQQAQALYGYGAPAQPTSSGFLSGMSDGAKIALGVGVLAVAGGAAYLLLRKK